MVWGMEVTVFALGACLGKYVLESRVELGVRYVFWIRSRWVLLVEEMEMGRERGEWDGFE